MKKLLIIAALLLSTSVASATCGRASHYGHGDGFHGKRTATGERMNAYDHTAATRNRALLGHRRIVTNQANGRSVTVRFNDYGPAKWTGKFIDLSYGAARAIGMGGTGTVCY